MFPPGVAFFALKLGAIWSGSVAVLYADLSVFSGDSLFGILGTVIIIAGGVLLTLRSNAIRYLNDEVKAQDVKIARLEGEKADALALAELKREEKHAALAELEAERKIRDLTPILHELVRLHQGQATRAEQEAELAADLSRLVASHEASTEKLSDLAEAVTNQTEVLARVLERLEPPTTEGGST